MHSVIELESFVRDAKAIMSDDERERLIDLVFAHPENGIPLGGGLWKMRVARSGGGKSGGFRTIYLFIGDYTPIFLIAIFAKNEKNNLSRKERAAFIEFGKALVRDYGAVG